MQPIRPSLESEWLSGSTLESRVAAYAVENLVPGHLGRVRAQREKLIDKTKVAVHERLTKEINYWDGQADRFRQALKRGKTNARLNMERAEQRAADMVARLESRMRELELERQISATPPIVEEVIERLTSQLGCQVEISLEVQAQKADGFDESTVRTISENSRTLKFDGYWFEEG